MVSKVRCFECNRAGAEHWHHVVPKSLGGRRTIPLCCACHSKVHDKDLSCVGLSVEAKRQRASQGYRVTGSIPYGWVMDATTHLLSEHPGEQAIIRGMIRDFKAGLSLRHIARTLDECGVPSKRDKGWNHCSIRKILKRGLRSSSYIKGAA